jgi:ABC-type arginine transport system ATPase subunit
MTVLGLIPSMNADQTWAGLRAQYPGIFECMDHLAQRIHVAEAEAHDMAARIRAQGLTYDDEKQALRELFDRLYLQTLADRQLLQQISGQVAYLLALRAPVPYITPTRSDG